MAQILVRNLDEEVVNNLKNRAKKNGRSLQAEVKIILEQVTNEHEKVDMATARRLSEQFQERFSGRKFIDSVDLIREDRDR